MKFIGPAYEMTQDWEGTLGRSRDFLIDGILRDGWLEMKKPGSVLIVEELLSVPFTLAFNYYDKEADLDADRSYWGDALYHEKTRNKVVSSIQFEILFAYQGEASHIRLRDVLFGSEKHKGSGSKFLAAVVDTALDIDVDKIFVHPGMDGSWYWTSRGAIIQNKDVAFNNIDWRAKQIIDFKPDDWVAHDLEEFRRIFAERDVMALHKMIARDDLLLRGRPMRRFLLQDHALGQCAFDLHHPYTQECLQKRLGFDTEKFSRCVRPVAAYAGPRAAEPAS